MTDAIGVNENLIKRNEDGTIKEIIDIEHTEDN